MLSCPSRAAVVAPTFNRVQDEMSNPVFGLSKADKAEMQAQLGEHGGVIALGQESPTAMVAAGAASSKPHEASLSIDTGTDAL